MAKWDSDSPEIYMPWRPWNLAKYAKTRKPAARAELCFHVLEQMLCALDCLAANKMIHRDVKPENILCWDREQEVVYQLADFGLANHQAQAKTFCGTLVYQAPELFPDRYGQYKYSQSPKMDIWSLFATVMDIHPEYDFPPRGFKTYKEVLRALRVVAKQNENLSAMVRINPNHRASAAQLLVAHFGGKGLTTPRNEIPPIVNITIDEDWPDGAVAQERPAGQQPMTTDHPMADYEPSRRVSQGAAGSSGYGGSAKLKAAQGPNWGVEKPPRGGRRDERLPSDMKLVRERQQARPPPYNANPWG